MRLDSVVVPVEQDPSSKHIYTEGISCRAAAGACGRAGRGVVALAASHSRCRPCRLSASPTITIWSDKDRHAAVTKVANDWAATHGVTVQVVEKDFGDHPRLARARSRRGRTRRDRRRPRLDRPARSERPRPAAVPQARRRSRSSRATPWTRSPTAPPSASSTARRWRSRTSVSSSTRSSPRSRRRWANLEQQALAFKKKKSGNIAIAVPQGAAGDAYHMYPFFSGLGGYVFGINKAGNLDPSDIGVANKAFLKNAPMIDKWNKEGLINSKVDDGPPRTPS